MTVGEKIQEVLNGIKVVENKEYNLMTISKEIWDSDYQSEPTIPLSVIEKIKAEIEKAYKHQRIVQGTKWTNGLLCAAEIIDRKIADAKGDKA